MLDLHVLKHHKNREWDTINRSSISEAVRAAPFDVSVHYLDGEEGHIGRSRARGYMRGFHPYVTYVDHDDYLLSDALAALWPALQQSPCAVFPGELTLQNGHVRIGSERHHLCVYKREVLIDHSKYVVCGDLKQSQFTDLGTTITVPHRGYVHRLYDSPGRKLRTAHLQEYAEVTNRG